MKAGGIAAILLVACAASSDRASCADIRSIARVEPALQIPRLVVPAGEPLIVPLVLSNPAAVPVEVPASCLMPAAFRFERVRDRMLLRPGRSVPGIGKPAPLSLAAGESRTFAIDVKKMYRRKRLEAGRYRFSWSCEPWETPVEDFVVDGAYDPAVDRTAIIETDLGTLEVSLMPEQAPEHVRRFVELARSGYYDGTLFHRVIPGVLAEAGDKGGMGSGGWRQLNAPEIDAKLVAGKGLVGAVRGQTTLTNASQFFILLQAQPSFQGMHTFFGFVTKGLEVLDVLSDVTMSAESGPGQFRPAAPVAIRSVEIRGATP